MFTVVTHNPADAPAEAVIAAIEDAVFVGLQEMADRHDLTKAMLEEGFAVISGTEPGQPSTPLFYRPDAATLIRSVRVLLSEAQDAGPGAGPDRVKAKWFIGGVFKIDGVRVLVGTAHLVASQHHPERHALAEQQAARLARLFRRHRRVILLMDANAEAHAPQLAALAKVGVGPISSAHIATHGKRAIDLIMGKAPRGFRVFAEGARRTGSDHRLRFAFLSMRRRRPLRPYKRVTHAGKIVDQMTHMALTLVEHRLGYPLTVVQGSYNAGGVAASGGTHDGGGVVDLAAWDHENKVRELRRAGFAAWYRTPDQGPWNAHVHAVLIGNRRLSGSAAAQVTAYLKGRNGLASGAPDDGPRQYTENRFRMEDHQ